MEEQGAKELKLRGKKQYEALLGQKEREFSDYLV